MSPADSSKEDVRGEGVSPWPRQLAIFLAVLFCPQTAGPAGCGGRGLGLPRRQRSGALSVDHGSRPPTLLGEEPPGVVVSGEALAEVGAGTTLARPHLRTRRLLPNYSRPCPPCRRWVASVSPPIRCPM